MAITLVTRHGVLERRVRATPELEVWAVYIDGKEAEAVAYPEITGHLTPGDRVLLNTTAMELELGTGGQHFILTRVGLGGPIPPAEMRREDGHIMKLRYTPLQLRVRAAEEEASPYYDDLRHVRTLPGTPVVCLGLHSQLGPAAAGVKAANPRLRVAFLMTDSGALPLAYSNLVRELKVAGLLDVTVTIGQAFGGDLEAVNPYSGLAVAAIAGKADVIIAGQGPGNVGTATALGYGGVEQALLVNAAAALQGRAIAVPRLSFADPRERHRGLSHHTATVLGQLALAPATIALPLLAPEQSSLVQAQLGRDGIEKHHQRTVDATPGITLCQQHGISLRSMGRSYDADPAFFQAAAAAGRIAAEMVGEEGNG